MQQTSRLIALVDAIRRKGTLPRDLAYLLWKGEGTGGKFYFKERITAYFHEKEGGGPYLIRPSDLNPPGLNSEPAWYDLSEQGHALAATHREYVFRPKRDHFQHRAMSGSVAASFELLAPTFGMTYIDKEELALRPAFPQSLGEDDPLGIRLSKGWVEPDDLFGLQYALPDGKSGTRYFAREDDRGTESFNRADKMQTSLSAKFDKYLELFASNPRLFRERWGITNMRVLFITTMEGRIGTCLRYLRGKPHADRFLFKYLPMFGAEWRAPREPIQELFTPWITTDEPFDITRP